MPDRVLVVIIGEARAHELTFALFKQNVLDPLGADLALCVGSPRQRDDDNPFYSHAKHVWEFPEPTDWAVPFDQYARGNWRCLLELKDQWMGGIKDPVHQHPGSAAVLIFFREFLRRRAQQDSVLDGYDWVIISRSDYIWPVPHPPMRLFSAEHIYFPDGERYRGFTDRYVIVPRRHLARFLDIPKAVFEEPEELARRMKALGRSNWNLETFIKFRVHELGLLSAVRFFPYFMYTVRPGDGSTRWSAGIYSHENRFFIKYPSEYNNALVVRSLVGNDLDWGQLIGWRRFVSWRMYFYCWMRAQFEKDVMPKRFRLPRLVKRFFVLLWQPLDPSRLDRLA